MMTGTEVRPSDPIFPLHSVDDSESSMRQVKQDDHTDGHSFDEKKEEGVQSRMKTGPSTQQQQQQYFSEGEESSVEWVQGLRFLRAEAKDSHHELDLQQCASPLDKKRTSISSRLKPVMIYEETDCDEKRINRGVEEERVNNRSQEASDDSLSVRLPETPSSVVASKANESYSQKAPILYSSYHPTNPSSAEILEIQSSSSLGLTMSTHDRNDRSQHTSGLGQDRNVEESRALSSSLKYLGSKCVGVCASCYSLMYRYSHPVAPGTQGTTNTSNEEKNGSQGQGAALRTLYPQLSLPPVIKYPAQWTTSGVTSHTSSESGTPISETPPRGRRSSSSSSPFAYPSPDTHLMNFPSYSISRCSSSISLPVCEELAEGSDSEVSLLSPSYYHQSSSSLATDPVVTSYDSNALHLQNHASSSSVMPLSSQLSDQPMGDFADHLINDWPANTIYHMPHASDIYGLGLFLSPASEEQLPRGDGRHDNETNVVVSSSRKAPKQKIRKRQSKHVESSDEEYEEPSKEDGEDEGGEDEDDDSEDPETKPRRKASEPSLSHKARKRRTCPTHGYMFPALLSISTNLVKLAMI
eukprot:scaffold2602_cov177-Ochromonas_danica.AAC.8